MNPFVIRVAHFVTVFALFSLQSLHADEPLPGTAPLELTGEIDRHLIAGVSQFLDAKLTASVSQRQKHWQRDFSSGAAYTQSLTTNRERLAHIVGLRDARPEAPAGTDYQRHPAGECI